MTADLERLRTLATLLDGMGAHGLSREVLLAVGEIEARRDDATNADVAAADALAVFERCVSSMVPEGYALGYREACAHIRDEALARQGVPQADAGDGRDEGNDVTGSRAVRVSATAANMVSSLHPFDRAKADAAMATVRRAVLEPGKATRISGTRDAFVACAGDLHVIFKDDGASILVTSVAMNEGPRGP